MKYGEEILKEFDPIKDLEIWPNKHEKNYTIKINLPEFTCLCPRSGYPDFANIYLEYVPNEFVVELKAIKLYINSFKDRNISHEDSINEIYDTLNVKLRPKFIKIIGDFNPRGNVHTIIEIASDQISKYNKEEKPNFERKFDRNQDRKFGSDRKFNSDRNSSRKFGSDRKFNSDRNQDRKFDSDKKFERKPREGFRKISYEKNAPRTIKSQ